MSIVRRLAFAPVAALLLLLPLFSQSQDDAARLIGTVMGPSPMEENLRVLTDDIGGRMSGSDANRRGVQWAIEAFRAAGVESVSTHTFSIPVE